MSIFQSDYYSQLTTGCSIEASGGIVASQGKGQAIDLQVSNYRLLGPCSSDFPLQKKRHRYPPLLRC